MLSLVFLAALHRYSLSVVFLLGCTSCLLYEHNDVVLAHCCGGAWWCALPNPKKSFSLYENTLPLPWQLKSKWNVPFSSFLCMEVESRVGGRCSRSTFPAPSSVGSYLQGSLSSPGVGEQLKPAKLCLCLHNPIWSCKGEEKGREVVYP